MKITQNGFYRVVGKHGVGGGTTVVFYSGTTGGAVVTLGYYDDYGTWVSLTDGTLSVGTQVQVKHGSDVMLYAQVSGASGTTAISLLANGKS